MPIPYIMTIELSIYSSNTQQQHQILEQLLMIFDPAIQIQKDDSAFDWTKISVVENTGVNIEENYPPGGDRRMLISSLTFDLPIYISAPMNIKEELVRSIIIRLGDLSGFSVNEYDDDGNLVPFTVAAQYGTVTVTG